MIKAARLARFGFLSLLILGSGCVIHASTGPNNPPPPATPPPAAFTHPGYAYAGQPTPPPPVMPPARSINDYVNRNHLAMQAAQPRKCNIPQEVAPGVFVHIDCYPYKRIGIAQKHATPTKINFMKLGRSKWKSFGFAPGQPPAASVGANGDAAAFPDVVDHRLNGTEGPVKDQGDVGACTAFALSSVMDNSLRKGGQNITTSPEHLWSHYAVPTMEDAASSNLNKGITTFESLPYSGKEACQLMRDSTDDCGLAYNVRPNTASSNPQLQQKLQAADASNGHRTISFEELEVSPPNIDEIVATLASGADLWTAFNIDSSVFTNRKIVNGVIPDWTFADGGHALAMSGYRKVNGSYQFLLHNSWGVSWGDQGYAWVSQNMVTRFMHLAYKVRTDVDGNAPPKTDEDCRGDQVLDTVTNKCTGVCPDQSRPANGQCSNGPAPGPQPLTLPGLPGFVIPGGAVIPGIPAIPGWPVPQQPQPAPTPNQPNQPAQPTQPAWPWPVPSGLPQFPFQPPPSQ